MAKKKRKGCKETELVVVITKDNDGYMAVYQHHLDRPHCKCGVGLDIAEAVRDLFYDPEPEKIFEEIGK